MNAAAGNSVSRSLTPCVLDELRKGFTASRPARIDQGNNLVKYRLAANTAAQSSISQAKFCHFTYFTRAPEKYCVVSVRPKKPSTTRTIAALTTTGRGSRYIEALHGGCSLSDMVPQWARLTAICRF